MKSYLSVSFSEKDEARKHGAKWDAENKKWYAPNNEPILLEKFKINDTPVVLVGEDRTYGGNDLFIDLIPRNCWYTNVRSCTRPRDWDRLRKHIYERVDYICECCGIDTKKSPWLLEAHERWDYNEETQIQRLVRIIALCHDCHQSTHMGLARIKGFGSVAREHLKKVRGFTEQEYIKHNDDATNIWEKRNNIKWTLELSLITNNDIKLLVPIPDENERRIISNNKINTIDFANRLTERPMQTEAPTGNVTCKCGAVITKKAISSHVKSARHFNALNAKRDEKDDDDIGWRCNDITIDELLAIL